MTRTIPPTTAIRGGQDDPGTGDEDTAIPASGQAPPSFDPDGTGEVMDAATRRDDEAGAAAADTAAEEQAWDEAMHQAMSLAKAQGKVPGAIGEELGRAHRSALDWRALLRRHMTDAARRDYSWSAPNRRFIDGGLYLPSIRSEGIDTIAVIVDISGSLPTDTLTLFCSRFGIRPSTPPAICRSGSQSRDAAAPTSGRASRDSPSRGCTHAAACT